MCVEGCYIIRISMGKRTLYGPANSSPEEGSIFDSVMPRPEDVPSVIPGLQLGRDPYPIQTRQGRLIPGPFYSQLELLLLEEAAGGETLAAVLPLPSLKQLGRITLNEDTGCWELPIYSDLHYGNLSVAGLSIPTNKSAHRTMYKVFYGAESIPDGTFLDHLCENTACCYPRHLEPVVPSLNTLRGRLRTVAGQAALPFDVD